MSKSNLPIRVLLVALCLGWLAACAAPAPRPTPDAIPPPAAPSPPPPAKPAEPAPPVSAEVAEELVAAHNFWRKQVKAPPLAWSESLSREAREWALTLLRKGTLEHNPNMDHGENIAWFAGERMKPSDVVDHWGNEVEFYDHEKNTCLDGSECRHYTQIVWKDTREVGCAYAWGEHPKYGLQEFWICNYSPAGNMEGLKPY